VIHGISLCIQQWRPGVYIGLPTCMYVICCLYLNGTDAFHSIAKADGTAAGEVLSPERS
jgi:hypothetical protein